MALRVRKRATYRSTRRAIPAPPATLRTRQKPEYECRISPAHYQHLKQCCKPVVRIRIRFISACVVWRDRSRRLERTCLAACFLNPYNHNDLYATFNQF